ncbi:MAG: MAPEG family protein [Sphingomonadaceae bacterium]|nr:MAPEG family protein [Sphingomonadaceae bacterium]
MQAQVLAPAAVLVLWSLVMLVWLAATRLPAMAKGGGLGAAKPGGRGQDLEGVLPDPINWKAHNYTHLMEQPTLFYATVAILAIMGPIEHDVLFAWAYVVIRIIHSLWQATVNTVPVRFTLFMLSTFCLLMLALHAAKLTLLGA